MPDSIHFAEYGIKKEFCSRVVDLGLNQGLIYFRSIRERAGV